MDEKYSTLGCTVIIFMTDLHPKSVPKGVLVFRHAGFHNPCEDILL